MSLRCTATVYSRGGVHRCLNEKIARDFCSSLYPDGPAIRLCPKHVEHFHRVTLNAVWGGDGSQDMATFERLCDEWRFLAPDCL